MDQTSDRHLVEEPDDPKPSLSRLTGSEYDYDYKDLEAIFPREVLDAYVHRTRTLFAPKAKAFDDKANTEWLLRIYLALKFILHATVMASSARYSAARNVQITVPYLIYYMLFSSCRAYLMTCPDIKWEGAATARLSHGKAIERTGEILKRLDAEFAGKVRHKLQAAKDQREMFSYHFPMSGVEGEAGRMVVLEEAIEVARLLATLAQLNSACLEGAVNKHGKPPFGMLEAEVSELIKHARTAGPDLVDHEDRVWLRKLVRVHESPAPVIALVSEGMTEDFFGIWCAPDPQEGNFDPDDDWRALLDLW